MDFTFNCSHFGNKKTLILGLDLSLRHSGVVIVDSYGHIMHKETIQSKISSVKKNKYHRLVCVGDNEEILEVFDITTNNHELHEVKRFIYIAQRISSIIKKYKITHVVLEGYAMGAIGSVFDIAEMGGLVKKKLFDEGFDSFDKKNFFIIPPTSLKGYICGKGNAKKEEMQKAIFLNYGIPFENDNEADAYALARMFLDLGEEIEIFCKSKGLDKYRKQLSEKNKQKEKK